MEKSEVQQLLDKLAISASALCMLHCLLTPILMVALPVISLTFFADESFHKLLVALVLPVSLVTFFIGCHRHKNKLVLFLGSIGLLSLVIVALIGHDLFGEIGEKVATVLSGIILVIGHARNYVLCRSTVCEY